MDGQGSSRPTRSYQPGMRIGARVLLLALASCGGTVETPVGEPGPSSGAAVADPLPTHIQLGDEVHRVVPCSPRRVSFRRGAREFCVDRPSVVLPAAHGHLIAQTDTTVVLDGDNEPVGLDLVHDRVHPLARIRAGWIPLTEMRDSRALFEMSGTSAPIGPCRGAAAVQVYFPGGHFCLDTDTVEIHGRSVTQVELTPNAPTYRVILANRTTIGGREFAAGARVAFGVEDELLAVELAQPTRLVGLTVPAGSIIDFGDELSIQIAEHPMTIGRHHFRPPATVRLTRDGVLLTATFSGRQAFGGRVFPEQTDGIWHVSFGRGGRISIVDCDMC